VLLGASSLLMRGGVGASVAASPLGQQLPPGFIAGLRHSSLAMSAALEDVIDSMSVQMFKHEQIEAMISGGGGTADAEPMQVRCT
jgi:hypothetical protein